MGVLFFKDHLMPYPSFEEYLHCKVIQFPSSLSSTSPENSKFKALDHLLNVIGNGIRDDEELAEELNSVVAVNKQNAMRYMCESTEIVIGYKDTMLIGDRVAGTPDSEMIVLLKEDVHLYPWIKHTLSLNVKDKKDPYQNFSKEYSLIYQAPLFLTLSNDWIESAIWFYEKCLNYFQTDECATYHGNPTHNHIDEFVDFFIQRYAEKYTKNPELLSLDWNNVSFEGTDFYNREAIANMYLHQWDMNKQNIIHFIKETIALLKTHLK